MYENYDFTIKLSMVEIYNDKIYDLLTDQSNALIVKGGGNLNGRNS